MPPGMGILQLKLRRNITWWIMDGRVREGRRGWSGTRWCGHLDYFLFSSVGCHHGLCSHFVLFKRMTCTYFVIKALSINYKLWFADIVKMFL